MDFEGLDIFGVDEVGQGTDDFGTIFTAGDGLILVNFLGLNAWETMGLDRVLIWFLLGCSGFH